MPREQGVLDMICRRPFGDEFVEETFQGYHRFELSGVFSIRRYILFELLESQQTKTRA